MFFCVTLQQTVKVMFNITRSFNKYHLIKIIYKLLK